MMNNERQNLVLTDGRQLSYSDQGIPGGKPVLLLHGTPGHALFWNKLPGFAEACEAFRFISVDRRGYGTSDYKRNHTFLDYVDDMAQLANHLDLEDITVLGVSGGGPYALACVYKMPEKFHQAVVVSGAGPSVVGEIEDALSRTNRKVYEITRLVPWLMNLNMRLLISWQTKNPVKFVQKMSYKFSGPDKEAIERDDVQEIMTDVYLNSYQKTWKGYARDVVLQANDWGFDLSRIEPRVVVIQAIDDTSSPPAVGDYFAKTIPSCELHSYENAGHLWHLLNIKEILSKI